MRSVQRTVGPVRWVAAAGPVRDVAALASAIFVVGISFGAIAAAAGISTWLAVGMSTLVFAGGSQFLAVGVVGAGGGALAAVVAGLLLNARHLPFGLAVGHVYDRGWPSRLLGSHLLIDESVAFALAARDRGIEYQRRVYWLCGVSLFVSWNVGAVIGLLAGRSVGDPAALGVDAAFPAGLLALVLPSLRERPALRVALCGAALALVTTPFLPAGLPVLVGLLALAVAGRRAGDRA